MKHTQTQRKWWGRSLQYRGSLWYNTLRHRRDRVKTQTLNTSATTSAVFVKLCVCVSVTVYADLCISTVREGGSSSQFLVVIFNQNCGGWMGKCVCLVLCLALGAPIISFCLSPALCERVRQTERERGNKLYLKIKCIREAKLPLPWCSAERCAVFNSVLY